MFKKFLAVLVLVVIFFCGQNNFASAKDIYIGTYSDGCDAYLMTDTISKHKDESYDDGTIIYLIKLKTRLNGKFIK